MWSFIQLISTYDSYVLTKRAQRTLRWRQTGLFSRLKSHYLKISLAKHTISKVAGNFNASPWTISSIRKKKPENGVVLSIGENVHKNRKWSCGRPQICSRKRDESLLNTSLHQFRTLKDVSGVTGFSLGTIWNVLKWDEIHRVSNTLKPLKSETNKIQIVSWALKFINLQTLSFSDMFDYVHLDEKWFCMPENASRFHLEKNESNTERIQ